MRSLVMSAAALAIAAMPAVAQKAGTVEIGVFGRQAWFDTSYELKDKAGAGARLGIFFARDFELEVQGSWVRTESERIDFNHSIDNYAGRAFLEYNINAKPVAFILGVGGHYQQYSGDTESLELGDCINIDACDDNSEYGPSGLIGVRFGVGGVLQVRVDGTVDYSPEPPGLLSRADDGWQYGIQGGLSLVFPKPKPVDTDMDGVPDKLDQCPNTPAGMPVDEKGCPLDDDKDGVINASDLCPNTPAGEAVDASGCSDSQKDDDRDGVMNSLDKCPNTPSGTAVDETGCPKDDDADGVANAADRCPNTPAGEQVDANGCGACQRDSDNDGVADCNDKCPSTNPGNRVDANGCRILGESGSLVLQGVNFASGSAVLTKASKAALDEVAALAIPVMQENASLRLEVGGHTDSTGSAKTNTRLSQRRAEAVEKYLESKGIDSSRLTAKGYGPDKPVSDNTTKEGRAANRRVELTPLY